MDDRRVDALLVDIYEKIEEVSSLKEKIENNWNITQEHRKQLIEKIDDLKTNDMSLTSSIFNISEKINELPCRERAILYKGLQGQITLLWGGFVTVVVVGIMLGVWIKIIIK